MFRSYSAYLTGQLSNSQSMLIQFTHIMEKVEDRCATLQEANAQLGAKLDALEKTRAASNAKEREQEQAWEKAEKAQAAREAQVKGRCDARCDALEVRLRAMEAGRDEARREAFEATSDATQLLVQVRMHIPFRATHLSHRFRTAARVPWGS